MESRVRRLLCHGLVLTTFVLFSVVSEVRAETRYIIDTPTTGMLDYGTYDVNFRFFSNGGILSRMDFGIFKIINLGVGWEVAQVVGTQPATAAPPALFIKVRPFNGGMILPALAFGYDGQGYLYNKETNEFAVKEKGIFLVLGREFLVPNLRLNAGMNMNDFKQNKLYGFTSLEYAIEEQVMFLVEYDNINYFPEARLNAGMRIFITEDINIDLAGRDIASSDRKAERIAKIGYTGRF